MPDRAMQNRTVWNNAMLKAGFWCKTQCYFNSFAMFMNTKKHCSYHKSMEIIRYFEHLWNANVLLLRKTHFFMLLTGIFYKKTHLQTNYTLHSKYSKSRNDAFIYWFYRYFIKSVIHHFGCRFSKSENYESSWYFEKSLLMTPLQ